MEKKWMKPKALCFCHNFLIAPTTKQETNPGPDEANIKSLDLAPQIYISYY